MNNDGRSKIINMPADEELNSNHPRALTGGAPSAGDTGGNLYVNSLKSGMESRHEAMMERSKGTGASLSILEPNTMINEQSSAMLGGDMTQDKKRKGAKIKREKILDNELLNSEE